MSLYERALKKIEEKEGKLIEKYDEIYLIVECKNGHTWTPRIHNLASCNSWCPECYGNKPLTIKEMIEIAINRGGECLSKNYNGLKMNLSWKCAVGHIWDATPNNVKNHKSWCPHCKINVGEEISRATFEEAFRTEDGNAIFSRTRKESWMEGLELDGYNKDLQIAFEYQGKQHYERVEHFQRNEGDFEKQLERDKLTLDRCIENKVKLFAIPYDVGFKNIRNYVRDELIEGGYQIMEKTCGDDEFYDTIRTKSINSQRQYDRALEIVKRKGGILLSQEYIGYRVPLHIKCGEGHEFYASLEAIDELPSSTSPRFCQVCGGTTKKPDDELKSKVEACGFTYKDVKSIRDKGGKMRRYLTVVCPNGHEYEVSWDNFCPKDNKPKKGCDKCFHKELGKSKRIDITEWCKQNNMLVYDYVNTTEECSWECEVCFTTFETNFLKLKQKKIPCTNCFINSMSEKYNIQLLNKQDDINATTKLNWKCNDCNDEFEISVISFGLKKIICQKCKKLNI